MVFSNITCKTTVLFCGVLAMTLSLMSATDAFAPLTSFGRRSHTGTHLSSDAAGGNGGSGGSSSNIERLEFKIYPDGRVEEKVMGVKGSDCQKITEKINAVLGEVVSSQPTEEMFEQEVKLDQTLTNNVDSSGGGDSWEGASSW